MSINLVQKFEVEVDSAKLLKKYLELAISTILDSNEEIAVKTIEHDDKSKIIYCPSVIHGENNMLPILLIGGWYKPENKKENSYFNGYKPWTLFNTLKKSINHIFTFINNNQDDLKKIFLKECGEGYNTWFNRYDGSIGVGYNLMSNNTFPNSLLLSLVHIYYGK
jgi:hypothetical protein